MCCFDCLFVLLLVFDLGFCLIYWIVWLCYMFDLFKGGIVFY